MPNTDTTIESLPEVTNPDIEQSQETYPYGVPGPSQSEIDSLKEKHGELELITLANRLWIYRQMLREEHLELLNNKQMDTDSDMLMVSTLLVWPDPQTVDWKKVPAGVVQSLSSEILVFSGFVKTAAPIKL